MQGEGHWAGRFAGVTGNTQFLLPVNLYKAEAIESAVNCSKRAQILTEWPINFYGEQHNATQNPQLPEEQPASLFPQGFICAEQGERTK